MRQKPKELIMERMKNLDNNTKDMLNLIIDACSILILESDGYGGNLFPSEFFWTLLIFLPFQIFYFNSNFKNFFCFYKTFN